MRKRGGSRERKIEGGQNGGRGGEKGDGQQHEEREREIGKRDGVRVREIKRERDRDGERIRAREQGVPEWAVTHSSAGS